jgi:uncharacterized protein (TIGR02266 family)
VTFVRENTRYPVELQVKVSCPSWDDYLDLYTTNLSRGGVFIASRMSAPMGTEITVELVLPNGSAVKFRAEVMHLVDEKESTETQRPMGMGVQFIDLDEDTRKALEAMVTVARFTVKKAGGAPIKVRTNPPGVPLPIPTTAPPPTPTEPLAKTAPRAPISTELIDQALSDELERRLSKRPHDQLGLETTAGEREIEDAYKRLKERYHPTIFERYGEATQEGLRKLNELLDLARAELIDPQKRAKAIEELTRSGEKPKGLFDKLRKR